MRRAQVNRNPSRGSVAEWPVVQEKPRYVGAGKRASGKEYMEGKEVGNHALCRPYAEIPDASHAEVTRIAKPEKYIIC